MPEQQISDLLGVREELHPDLAASMRSGPLGPMIHHPLIVEIALHEGFYALTNKRYEQKLGQIKKAREEGNWEQFVWAHERPYRFEALLEALNNQPADPAGLIAEVWIDAENPGINRELWINLFENIPCPALDALPEKFRIYRGTRTGDTNGISWTMDKKTAAFFANRFHEGGIVQSRMIRRSDALFYTNERGEQEIIYVNGD
jgi:hypothetical protein